MNAESIKKAKAALAAYYSNSVGQKAVDHHKAGRCKTIVINVKTKPKSR